MELQHFSHDHPLILSEDRSHEADDEKTCCSACGEVVGCTGQRFSCVACGFHLHKNCAEAASQLNHPFHRNHTLNLLASSPYGKGKCVCDFCGEGCDNFVYHCSCKLDFHIKCALLSYSIARKTIGQLQHIAHKDPLITTETHSEYQVKEAKCFACWKPLLDSAHLCLDSGFCIHKSCVELPLELNHLSHRQHSLFLQFNSERVPCQICQETQRRGSLVYCCSNCKFCLHIECVSPSPIIEDPSCHEHPFARCFRHVSFICDACGTSGDGVFYICTACSLVVHKKCISLPRIIKSIWHHHPISHNYFLLDNEYYCGVQECGVCHEEVKKECGSYSCSHCANFIVHVKCALEDTLWYYKIESKDAYEDPMLAADTMDPIFSVIKEIKLGDNVINSEIMHSSHPHNIVLSDEVKDDSRCCDGCSRLIIAPFYDCLQCDFCLHKSCAELPRKKLIWFHIHQLPFNLVPNLIFRCDGCREHCSGFAYECGEYLCNYKCCIRCTEISLARESPGHKHILRFYRKYNIEVLCKACGRYPRHLGIYRCKDCNFNVHVRCALFPQITRHKCDEHRLILTYHEDNDYAENHYCDICEERRDPDIWFYYCVICDTSTHLDCALENYPYIKCGLRIVESDHRHSLVVMQRYYRYPKYCCKCGQRCFDLALECSEIGCNYIIHWSCSSAAGAGAPSIKEKAQ